MERLYRLVTRDGIKGPLKHLPEDEARRRSILKYLPPKRALLEFHDAVEEGSIVETREYVLVRTLTVEVYEYEERK